MYYSESCGDFLQTVQPIRDERKVNAMKKILKAESLRDYALFTLGINTGLRISDLLSLTFGHIERNGKVKDRIYIREEKTDKENYFSVGPSAKKALQEYIDSVPIRDYSDPVFFSRKFAKGKKRRPISRQRAYTILNEAAAEIGIEEPIGCHTLRKTFGYMAYNRGYDLALIQETLNHSSQKITLRYIGITQDQKDELYISLNL